MFSRKFIIIFSLVVFTGVGYGCYRYFYPPGDTSSLETTHESEVASGEFVDAIRVIGTAKLAYEQKLRFSGGGKVSQVLVKPGQHVKKGELLAVLDMQEYNETITQAQERVSLASQKLKTAREKIGGLELQKLEAELRSLESKKVIIAQDLQKLIRAAPIRTETIKLEREQKQSEILSKQSAYDLDYQIWKRDRENITPLVSKKELEASKVLREALTDARSELSDFQTIQSNFNKIFGFESFRLSNEERSDAIYNGWNVSGFRQETEVAWRALKDPIENLSKYLSSIESKTLTLDHAIEINRLVLIVDDVSIKLADLAKKTMDNTEPQVENSFSQTELDAVRSKVNGYRTTIISKNNAHKDTKNLLPLVVSPEFILAQVEKELAERKLILDGQKIAIEKLKIELIESGSSTTISGSLDMAVRRDIDTKKQELLEVDVNIATKHSDIKKQSSGTSDEIISLESELKQAQSELNKSLSKREQYEMRAPIDGMIRSVKILPGDALSTSTPTGNEGTIIIEDNNAVMVVAKLGQKDIVRIRQNGEASITVDAFPGATFSGTITEISSSPDENSSNGETLYEIRVLFDRGEYAVYSGMSANLEIVLSKKDDVIFVPLTAITTDGVTGESSVTIILPSGGHEKRVITLGQVDGDRVEVLSGLTSGEKVLSIDFSSIDYQEPTQGGMMP